MTKDVQPIFIMPEGSQRTTGRPAQRNNILAAKLVAETVRTTLGPKGMDKMLVDGLGDVTVTNDGVTILREMHIEHPAAKMIVEVAKTQENEVGDGTTTAVVLAGALLKEAEKLIEQEVHPSIITRGYRLAAEKAQQVLENLAVTIAEGDTQILQSIANTAMTGKGAENSKELLSKLTVQAVQSVVELKDGKKVVDTNAIKLQKKTGGSVEDSTLIAGIVIDKERVHASMPKIVKDAKIVLIDSAVEIKSTEIDAKIQINDPTQMQAFLDQEENMLRRMVDKVASSGATILFCQKGIDDVAQHFLAKKGVFAVRRVKKSDMEALSKATGAKVVTNLDDLSAADLGFAGSVEERKIGDENMTVVEHCQNPKAVTIMIRAGTGHVADEVKRAVDDAIGDVAAALRSGKVVAGAGSTEIELYRSLRVFANSLSGREQLAAQAFADAMEVIPRTLAENAGLDPIDVLTELKAAHEANQKWAGVNVFTGKVMDAWSEKVIEPLQIKTQAVSSATEVATMILRIDDVIQSGSGAPSGPPGGMPPGMMG
jgi:archaeal chaperonin